MKGYVVANIRVTNADGYKVYGQRAEKIVHRYGGRYLIRGASPQKLEGDAPVDRIVVLEFPSVAEAQGFYNDPEYRKVIKSRHENSVTHSFVIVEGFSG